MLEKPKNYEEARKVIETAVDDEWQTKDLKTAKLRLLLAVGAGAAVSVAAGVMTEDPTMGVIVFFNAMILASPFSIPYVKRKRVIDAVHDGSYFDKADADGMIDAANQYVDLYNEREEKQRKERARVKQ